MGFGRNRRYGQTITRPRSEGSLRGSFSSDVPKIAFKLKTDAFLPPLFLLPEQPIQEHLAFFEIAIPLSIADEHRNLFFDHFPALIYVPPGRDRFAASTEQICLFLGGLSDTLPESSPWDLLGKVG